MKPTVFIHTNPKQIVGAIVSQYSMRRNSRRPDDFDIRVINTGDHPFLQRREGQEYLRDGVTRVWHNSDLQSFTPLRFMPPELMGYAGRAVVVDPDVFAVGDVWELLDRDMRGAAIMCRPRSGAKEKRGMMATSVMLLDCAKLTHWRCEEQFNEMFALKRDYMKWIGLLYEDPKTIAPARERVERLRQADRADEDAPQHQAQDPAVEDRACRWISSRRRSRRASSCSAP